MTIAAWGMAAATLATMWLTFRDPAVADTGAARAALSSAWLAIPIGFALLESGEDPSLWAGAAVLVTACVATGGRPGLVMDEILPRRTRADENLMRRTRIGQISVLAVILVAALFVS